MKLEIVTFNNLENYKFLIQTLKQKSHKDKAYSISIQLSIDRSRAHKCMNTSRRGIRECRSYSSSMSSSKSRLTAASSVNWPFESATSASFLSSSIVFLIDSDAQCQLVLDVCEESFLFTKAHPLIKAQLKTLKITQGFFDKLIEHIKLYYCVNDFS